MKIDCGVKLSDSVEPKKKSQRSVVGDVTLDLSYKLFLIGQLYKNKEKVYHADGSAISESILLDSGVYLEASECDSLKKKYGFMFHYNHSYSIFFSAVLVLFYLSISKSLVDCALALILMPFIINFCNEMNVLAKLFFFDPKKLIPSVVTDAHLLGSVAVVIASRNEPFDVAKMTFDSALGLIYPYGKKEIIVVDNSEPSFHDYEKWKQYVESFSEGGSSHTDGLRVVFIHREGKEGFKPRNLDIAVDSVTADFILYLDVDSTLLKDTLLRIVPIFLRDKKLGFIQLQTVPTNIIGKSPLSLVQGLRNYFLRMETVFCASANQSLFYGHNAIWRTKAVRDIGDCLEYHNNEVVVTEDLSMSFRARFKEYYGIGAWLESGEWVPESMRETEAMWLRWTVGTYQVYAKHFTKIENLKKFRKQELIGWLQHAGVLINYGLLPMYIALGLFCNSAFLWMVLLSLLPEIIQGICAYFKLSLGGMSPWKKAYKCYCAFFVLGSFINWIRCIGLWRYIIGKKQGWTPTGKAHGKDILFSTVVKERYGFILFGVGCFCYSIFELVSFKENIVSSMLFLLAALYGLNCMLAVYLFGRSNMQEDTHTATVHGNIEYLKDFYLSNE